MKGLLIMTNCYLEFHFKNEILENELMAFSHPIKILQTNELNEIPEIMRQIENYVNRGFYAAGYISYEAAPAFDRNMSVNESTQMPLIWFGLFSEPTLPRQVRSITDIPQLSWKMETSKKEYEEAFSEIHHQIGKGSTYQVNHTVRFKSVFDQDPYLLFLQLLTAQQANYSAYLDLGPFQIASASPELFFSWDGQEIITKPMKGTIRRGFTFEEDQNQFATLKHSQKDQAENVMIVDLLRNDLSRIARPGTVQVTRLFDIEAYPTVYQMTSTIEAKTKEGLTFFELFQSLFPCGSVTGAPKLSTMSLITKLEKEPRNVYCGAIGYIQPDKKAVFNVPIRTVWVDQKSSEATFGVGGGVTWDSTLTGEYAELLSKVSFLKNFLPDFYLIESFRLDNGYIFLQNRHMERLIESARYFNYQLDEKKVKEALDHTAKNHPNGLYKLRLLLTKTGTYSIETHSIEETSKPQICCLANHPVNKSTPFLYHKTTLRTVYEERRKGNDAFFDTLLWNEDRHLTEFTNGNVVFLIKGKRVTPPIKDGLLGGTFRKELLDTGEIIEQSLSLDNLKEAEAIWFINSVRKWIKVILVEH
jgi:para-aminobenzoate synthetase / 4-amino-4-deoxychorismate lyase